MSKIIELSYYRKPSFGNGALSTVRTYFENGALPIPHDIHAGDYFLAWLWKHGFKVVPLESMDEKPAKI